MRKWTRNGVALLLVVLLLTLSATFAWADNGDTIVYKTRTGECYHRSGCSYLKSKIPVTLSDAVAAGLRPCSRCKPPILDSTGSLQTPKPERETEYGVRSIGTGRSYSSDEKPTSSTSVSIKTQRSDPFNFIFEKPGIVFIGAFAVIWGAGAAVNKIGEKKRRRAEEKQRAEEKLRWEEERKKYVSLYKGKDPLSLTNAPSFVYITKDGLPAQIGQGKWGEGFTVYASGSGTTYHSKPGCSGASVAINITQVGNRRPCQRCKPLKPDLEWYYEWLRIRKIKDEYGIE